MTTFLGYFDQVNRGLADSMEDTMGVGFRCIRLNNAFNDGMLPGGGGKYLDQEYDRILAKYGYAPRGFWNMNLDGRYITFGDVAAHKADEVIRARAQLIKNNPRWTKENPLFVSPHHEQFVDNLEPNAAGEPTQVAGGLPADYPGFYKRVYEIFQEEGVLRKDGGSVLLCFIPTVAQFHPEKATDKVLPWLVDKIAPAPNYYTYTGCDIYSKTNYKRADASDLDAVSAWAKKVGKKYIIGEVGAFTSTVAGQQAGWIRDAHKRVVSHGTKDAPGSCNAMCWTFKDFPDGTSTRVDLTKDTMTAFTEIAKDPVFQRKL